MSGSAGDNSKPRVVVLGGCGFIGRNLVEYLVANDLVSGVRVVDKTPPQLAFLNPAHTKVFEDPRVEYKSANLINPASCASALDPADGASWSLVINCAGETRVGQTEAVYAEGIVTLSTNVAKQCAKQNVPRLVEISSGHMYSSDKVGHFVDTVYRLILVGQTEAVYTEGIVTLSTNVAKQCAKQNVPRLVEISSGHMYSSDKPHKESDPVEPWTVEGRMKYKVEQELKKLEPELNYTVLRPAIVYGVADRRSLTPRLLYGGIYKHLNETMKLLWTADLKMNTVHVTDVCRAAWTLGRHSDANRQVYNVVDDANTTQGSLAELVSDIFKINHDYYGTAISTLAKVYNVVDDANTTQGSLAELVSDIFKINHDYYGTAISTLAKNDIASVAEEANDKHLTAWADICRRYSLAHTPLEPSAGAELLLNKRLCLSGEKLKAILQLDVPKPTTEKLLQHLDKAIAFDDIYRRYPLTHTPLEPSAGAELLLNKRLCLSGEKLKAILQLDVPKPTVEKLLQVLEDYASMNLFPKELLL